jgi:hypothetical protein
LVAPATALVGNTLTVSTRFGRTTAPAAFVGGAVISFALSGPASDTKTGTTAADGTVSVTFDLPARGVYSVVASYDGVSTCLDASTSNTISSTVYQRTTLSVAPQTSICGAGVVVEGTLLALPGSAPVGSQNLQFDFSGVIAGASGTTGVDGKGSATVTFPEAGSYPVVGSFLNIADFFTNSAGAIPPVATTSAPATFTVNKAVTVFSTIQLPIVSTYVQDDLPVSVTFTRTDAPAGPQVGIPIIFTLLYPDDSSTQLTGVTGADGKASVTFLALPMYGPYKVDAQFDGDSCLIAIAPNTEPSAVLLVTQKTSLAVNSNTGICDTNIVVSGTLTREPQGDNNLGDTLPVVFSSASSTPASCTSWAAPPSPHQCTLKWSAAGTFAVNGAFTDPNGMYEPSTGSNSVVVSTVTTTLAYTGKLIIPTGGPFAFTARLRRSAALGSLNVVGRTVSITLGIGATAQSCSGVTDSTGTATCNINVAANQPLGTNKRVVANFVSDGCYAASTATVNTILVFAFPPVGVFSIGNLATGPTYTFFSSTWFTTNPTSPASTPTTNTNFKGFGSDIRNHLGATVSQPVCSPNTGYVNSLWDDASRVPAAANVPTYMGVIRTPRTPYDPATGPGGAAGNFNHCSSNPCVNGGTCGNNYGGGFYCNCPINKSGAFCQLNTPGPNVGVGNGAAVHGTGNPGDTTVSSPSIVVLAVTGFNGVTGTGTMAGTYC